LRLVLGGIGVWFLWYIFFVGFCYRRPTLFISFLYCKSLKGNYICGLSLSFAHIEIPACVRLLSQVKTPYILIPTLTINIDKGRRYLSGVLSIRERLWEDSGLD
jgi:hypothetical protein